MECSREAEQEDDEQKKQQQHQLDWDGAAA